MHFSKNAMREKLSLLATVVGVTLSVIRPLRCEITCAQLISSHCSLEVSPREQASLASSRSRYSRRMVAL